MVRKGKCKGERMRAKMCGKKRGIGRKQRRMRIKCNFNGKKQMEKKGLSPAMVVGQDKVVANGVVLLPHSGQPVIAIPYVHLTVP